MFLAAAVLLGLMLGIILRRDVTRLIKPGLYGIWLPIVAFGLEFSYKMLSVRYGTSFDFQQWYWLLIVITYGAVAFFCVWNMRYWVGSSFFLLGTMLNFLVIGCNGWRMPVSAQVLQMAGMGSISAAGQLSLGYFIAGTDTALLWLGDIFYVPVPYFNGFMSVGDILLCVGLAALILSVLRPEKYHLRHQR